jgi:hypothetical protein
MLAADGGQVWNDGQQTQVDWVSSLLAEYEYIEAPTRPVQDILGQPQGLRMERNASGSGRRASWLSVAMQVLDAKKVELVNKAQTHALRSQIRKELIDDEHKAVLLEKPGHTLFEQDMLHQDDLIKGDAEKQLEEQYRMAVADIRVGLLSPPQRLQAIVDLAKTYEIEKNRLLGRKTK